MIASLIGAHRTGKTTLARHYAQKTGCLFLETSTSAVFAELGVDPAKPMDFKTRMNAQEKILETLEAQYRAVSLKHDVITDRSPLDMIAYTMGDAVGDAVPEDQQERFAKYIDKCFEVTNKYFGVVVLVQPGIAMEPTPGKAAANRAYCEHLNLLLKGVMGDDRLTIQGYHLKKTSVDLEKRFAALDFCVKRSLEKAEAELVAFKNENRQTN
jgi:predicted ATPase